MAVNDELTISKMAMHAVLKLKKGSDKDLVHFIKQPEALQVLYKEVSKSMGFNGDKVTNAGLWTFLTQIAQIADMMNSGVANVDKPQPA